MFILLCYSPTLPGHVSPHTATTGQAGYQEDSTLDPRFLEPNLPRTQEIRQLEACHQPQRPQQVPMLSTLPHGDARLHHVFTTARSLGHLAGLQGRLLSRPSCTRTSTLPQLLVQSPLLPVPGPPFQSGNISVPLRSPSQGSRNLCQEPGPLLTPLSGRLEHLGPLGPILHGLDLVAPHLLRATRPSRQHGQVQASAISTLCVHGHQLRPGQRDGQTAPHRVQNLLLSLQTFTSLRVPLAIKWQQLLGHMTSLERLTLWGRLHIRPVQFALKDNWDQSLDHPCTPVLTPQDVRSALQWWNSPLKLLQGVPLHPPSLNFSSSPTILLRDGGLT